MEVDDVLELLAVLDAHELHYWLDGGWGIDCLLGEQTRDHGDLDLVVDRRDLPRVRAILQSRGYTVLRDWSPTAIALRDLQGREVDLHPIDPTPDGGGDQVLDDGRTWHYAAPVHGSISGRQVRCAPTGDQVAMHQGYELRSSDLEDVRRLAERFDLQLPPEFPLS